MTIFNFVLDSTLDYDENSFRFLFFNDDYKISSKVVREYYNKKFLNLSSYNNFLYKIPMYLDFDFIFNFYDIKDDKSKYNFLLKYINCPTIIHFNFFLQGYNLGFIHQFYKVSNYYNLNKVYDFLFRNKKDKFIEYCNSRKCIIKNTKQKDNLINVIYNIDFTIENVYIIKNNIDKIVKSKNINNIIIIYSYIDSIIKHKIDSIFEKLPADAIVIDYNSFIDLSSDFLLQEYSGSVCTDEKINKSSLYKKYCFAYNYFCKYNKKFSVKNKNNISKHIYLLVNSNLFINDILDNIFDYYFSIKNRYLSLYDFYDSKFLYNISFDFFITDKKFFIYDFYKKNLLKNTTNLLNIKNNSSVLEKIPVAFISIDDFLPYYSRLFNRVKLIKKPHMLLRKNSPVFDLSSQIFLNIVNNNKPLDTTCTYKIAVVVHIGKLEKLIFENLNFIIKNNDSFQFICYITISEKISKKEFNRFIKKYDIDIRNFNIYFVENIGADLFPFINVYLNHILQRDDFWLVLKIHTKTDILWRNELLYPFINKFKTCVQIMSTYEHIGCISSGEWIMDNEFMVNEYFLNFLYNYRHVNVKNLNFKFVGGTIFMIKKSVLDFFFKDFRINLEYEKSVFEVNREYEKYINHKDVHYAHCWERIISGLSVSYSNCTIFGL